jgi:hypothetical protein
MNSNPKQPSELIQALQKLTSISARPVGDDTAVPLPQSHFISDHCLAKHIARTKESFAFVPDLDPWRTNGIFRSANEAWQHDKLPARAVCAYSKSPGPFQRETGIQADTADQFLSDLKLAHCMVPTLGASLAYIIRHHHNKYDEQILPAHTNLVVYQPHGLSSTQLIKLFLHVADVKGKIILCDNRSDLAVSHPYLSEPVETSIEKAVPRNFRTSLEPPPRHEQILIANILRRVLPHSEAQDLSEPCFTHAKQSLADDRTVEPAPSKETPKFDPPTPEAPKRKFKF